MELTYTREGENDITITLPDRWTMEHLVLFAEGQKNAPAGSPPMVVNFYGAVALCEKIDGLDFAKLGDVDLDVWGWIYDNVYLNGYLEATSPKKKTS